MKVTLVTPCRSGFVHWDHMLSVGATFALAYRKGIEFVHHVLPGCPLLNRARNRLVAQALHEGADYLFCIDDDIAWNAPDFFKLLDWDVDVVAAAPSKRFNRWDEKPDAAVQYFPGEITEIRHARGRLWYVSGIATAFAAIKTDVFRKMESVTEPYVSDGADLTECRNWFWNEIIPLNGRMQDEGEDYNFSRKWRSLGGDCFVEPDIRLRHYSGNVCFDSCPADFATPIKEAVNG